MPTVIDAGGGTDVADTDVLLTKPRHVHARDARTVHQATRRRFSAALSDVRARGSQIQHTHVTHLEILVKQNRYAYGPIRPVPRP